MQLQIQNATKQESLRLAALLARSLITKQEKRQSSHRMFPQSYLQRKRNDETVAKKSSPVYPNLFCANREKDCC